MKVLAACSVAVLALTISAHATNYVGNGNTGFGGPVGTGSLDVTDNGTTATFTFNRGSGNFNDGLAIYIDSTAGGFTSTSGFLDNSDGGHSVVSGFGGGNQSVMTFDSGFLPDYGISIENGYASLFQLANGPAGSFTYITGASQSSLNNSATYSLTINLAQIGLTPGAGQSFGLFGTLISTTGYRSTEALAGNDTGTQGVNPFTQTSFASYTTTAVPEPTTLALAGLSGCLTLLALRRRK